MTHPEPIQDEFFCFYSGAKQMDENRIKQLLFALFVAGIVGCGQKGDLYFPKEQSAVSSINSIVSVENGSF